MKSLYNIYEGILDMEEQGTNLDKCAENPFKFLANITYAEGSNPDTYIDIMKNIESVVAADSKKIPTNKSTKYKIGFKYTNQPYNGPAIVIKSGKYTYAIRGVSGFTAYGGRNAPFLSKFSAQNGPKAFRNCDVAYLPPQSLVDQWLEFLKLCCTSTSKDIYSKEWEAWEEYKRS